MATTEEKPDGVPPREDAPDRVLDFIDRTVRFVALWGGGVMVLCLMGLIVTEVMLRYAFNAPLFGARDFAKIMLLITFAFSIGYSARTGGQVAVELLGDFIGPRFNFWSEFFVKTIGAAMLVVLSWRLWVNGLQAAEFGEASEALLIPFKPFYFTLSFGMLLYALVLIAEIIARLRGREIKSRLESA